MVSIDNKVKNIIIHRIKEILGKENVLSIVLYGSRVTGCNHPNSDYDVYVITQNNEKYFGRVTDPELVIDYHTENITNINSLSVEDVVRNRDRTMFSILTSGIVIYAQPEAMSLELLSENIICSSLSNPTKRRDPKSSANSKYNCLRWLDFYRTIESNEPGLKAYSYYNLIEAIRRYDSDKNSYDLIPTFKFFDLMNNVQKRKNYGISRIPSSQYVSNLANAIKNKDIREPYFSGILDIYEEPEEKLQQTSTDDEIKQKIVIIKNSIERVRIVRNQYYYTFYYYVLLEKIRHLYSLVGNGEADSLEEFMNKNAPIRDLITNSVITPELASLEEILFRINQKHKIDFDNYQIRIKRAR